MKIYLTRHGETIENKKRLIMGHQQGTLSAEGKQQAKRLSKRLKDVHFDYAFASDLSRAKNTAQIILQYHPETELQLTPLLREIDFGNFTGKSLDEVDWSKFPDGGESLSDVQNRAKEFLAQLINQYSDATLLLVSHNAVNKAFVTLMMGKPAEYIDIVKNQHPTALNIFTINSFDDYVIELENSNDHLI